MNKVNSFLNEKNKIKKEATWSEDQSVWPKEKWSSKNWKEQQKGAYVSGIQAGGSGPKSL